MGGSGLLGPLVSALEHAECGGRSVPVCEWGWGVWVWVGVLASGAAGVTGCECGVWLCAYPFAPHRQLPRDRVSQSPQGLSGPQPRTQESPTYSPPSVRPAGSGRRWPLPGPLHRPPPSDSQVPGAGSTLLSSQQGDVSEGPCTLRHAECELPRRPEIGGCQSLSAGPSGATGS